MDTGFYDAIPLADRNAFVETLKWGAMVGDCLAQYRLGVLYATGRGVLQDMGTAKGWWVKAARNGSAEAISEVGEQDSPTKLRNAVEQDRQRVRAEARPEIPVPSVSRVSGNLRVLTALMADLADTVRSVLESAQVNNGVLSPTDARRLGDVLDRIEEASGQSSGRATHAAG